MTAPSRRGRGGQQGHEPRVRIREREHEVVRLATEGQSQHAIARALGISQPAVSQILARVNDRWVKDHADQLGRHKAELARKLQWIYREGVQAWEASKAPHARRRQLKTDTEAGGHPTVAEVVIEDSHGDPRYLDTALRALVQLARVLQLERVRADGGPADEPLVFTMRLTEGPFRPRVITPTPLPEGGTHGDPIR